MPRNYRKKSERGIAKPDEMLRAVRYIKSTGESIQKTAKSFGINYNRGSQTFIVMELMKRLTIIYGAPQ